MVNGWSYFVDVNLKMLGNLDDGYGIFVVGIIGVWKDDVIGIVGIVGGNVVSDLNFGIFFYGVKIFYGNSN